MQWIEVNKGYTLYKVVQDFHSMLRLDLELCNETVLLLASTTKNDTPVSVPPINPDLTLPQSGGCLQRQETPKCA